MTTQELLSELLKLDIKLWVDGERLRYNAPQGAMTPELQAELVKHKSEIIRRLQSSGSTGSPDSPSILPVERPAQIPLSFAQQRLWFVDQLEPGSSAYNMFNAVHLGGPLDVDALEQGYKQIVQRHEALRTTFKTADDQPQQVIAPNLEVTLPLIDLSTIPQSTRETEVRRLIQEEGRQPFDLATGPLVRCSLLRLPKRHRDDVAADEHILLLTMHHIISDGWSMGVLFREIVLLGQAYAAGQPAPLPDLPLQYPDFAIWQRNWLQGAVLETQMDYWKKQLAGAPAALELPTDHARPAIQTYRGARLQVSLSAELSNALQALSYREDATLFMTLLAAFQVLLARCSGQTDIVVGSPVANRSRTELEGLIGFFVNTLALRTDLSGNPSFRELLARVRETCLGAYDHQDIPFEKLVDELHVPRDLSRNPLFQVMFILQNTPQGNPDLGDLMIEPLDIQPDTSQFDLRLSLQETTAGLTGILEYSTDLFEQHTAQGMFEHFQSLLAGIVADPDQQFVPNGKIDPNALPQQKLTTPSVYVAPRTPLEQDLTDIWKKILRAEKIGVHDNFFDLGGDSLLATQVASRLRRTFQVEFPLRTMFQSPTVAGLAEWVEAARKEKPVQALPLVPASRNGPLPLSFAQQRLWFVDQLQPGSTAYNIFNAVRLRGLLDVAALAQGYRQIIQRHESLRTTFQITDEQQPQQVIAPTLDVSLPLVDLSTLPRPTQEAEVQRLIREEGQSPFDLSTGPLIRGVLLRLGETEHILLLTMHHIISDGWSMGVLFREIILLGQAFASGQPVQLPELALQYPDFTLWQREWLQGAVLERQMAYWKEQLAGVPVALELPTDRPRPAMQTSRGACLHVTLPQELNQALQTLSRREDATLFMLLLAAFQATLWRYSGQADIVIGSPVANRNRSELEALIGFFVNTLALRTDLSGNPSFRELLKRVRAVCLGAYDHQDVPFEKVVDEIQIKRDLSRNPLFQVMFILQNVQMRLPSLPGLEVEGVEIEMGTAQFDLLCSLHESPAGLSGFIEYNSDLFDRETVVLLFDLFRGILESWVQDPEQPLESVVLPEALRARAETARVRDRRQVLAVAATFTAEPLEEALTFWAQELGLRADVAFAPYNQVFQQLLDPASLFSQNDYGLNLALVRFEDWLRDAQHANQLELLERNLADLENALLAAALRTKVPCLLLLCPPSPGCKHAALFLEMEQRLGHALAASSNLLLVPSTELAAAYPVAEYYDPATDELGHVPYTPAMFAALGTVTARKMHLLRSAPYKVVVLDCDNTLWKGVCAEDGPLGVEIDTPHLALQEFMLRQQASGKLLCLCSKNEEPDVWEVFEKRPEMPLKREQVLAWRINWQPKSENLRSLAEELNLGLDSFIFVDDNPLECAEVRANCPQAFVLELPAERERLPQVLQHQWAFDQLTVTSEDQRRTQMYQENLARQRLQSESMTFEKFIAQLELKIDIQELEPSLLARAAQLTQRTNQFNTTTLRRTEAEVQALGAEHCRVVDVCDRFGSYGLVGAMFYRPEGEALLVDSFLMSCRVLGRGVEGRMLAWLGEEACRQGLERVDVQYTPSQKNRPVLDFLEKVGKAYEEREAGASVFRFPLAALQGLEGMLLTSAAVEDGDGGQQSAPEAVLNLDAARLNRIARELWEPERILKEMQVHKPTQQRKGSTQYEAPRNPAEQALAEIWKQVLNLQQVGIHDNFFEAGGDSLLGLRVIALTRQAGIHLIPRQIFQHQTIAELAKVANVAPEIQAEQGIVTGTVPLTPNQHWFLERDLPHPEQWLISLDVETLIALAPERLKQAAQILLRHHDALRTRFVRETNHWRQFIVAPDDNATPFTYMDLSAVPEAEQDSAMQTAARQLQNSLNLVEGPLLQIVYFDLGAKRPGRLLLIMNHLIGDAYSLQVLAADFQTIYRQFAQGEAARLEAKTTSYKEWAGKLSAYAQSPAMRQELDYWLGLPWKQIVYLPYDLAGEEENTSDSVRTHTVSLNKKDTATLLKAYPTGLQEVLLTAFGQTLAHWTNSPCVIFILIINGREAIFDDVDLSRTVGHFALGHPVILDMADARTPAEILSTVKEQLARIPNHGISHGLLRLTEFGDVKSKVKKLNEDSYHDKVVFNYIPSMGGKLPGDATFRPAKATVDLAEDPQNKRDYVLKCTASIFQDQFIFNWEYSTNLHRPDTIKTNAQFYLEALRALAG